MIELDNEIKKAISNVVGGETQMSNFLDVSNSSFEAIYSNAINMINTVVGYKELRMMYACALKEIHTKFDVLNTEYNVRYKRNPISSIQSRIKSNNSLIKKMYRKNVNFNLQDIECNLNDIAGIRVVCSYIDDVYSLADSLTNQDDITLISKKDYIKNPKENGYRSLHLIVGVPVFFAEQKKQMKVEVQIRTIAMDYWASLEHQLKYKKEIKNQALVCEKLKQCAKTLYETDNEMLAIRTEIEKSESVASDEEELFEKLSHLDEPIT